MNDDTDFPAILVTSSQADSASGVEMLVVCMRRMLQELCAVAVTSMTMKGCESQRVMKLYVLVSSRAVACSRGVI
jgi:hypothetical protein